MEASGTPATRNCVSCGRSISWDANVCPYCGHDYRMAMMGPAQTQARISDGMKILLYIVSFIIPLVGLIVGIIYYTKPEPEYKEVGKICLIIALVAWVIGAVCWAAFAL